MSLTNCRINFVGIQQDTEVLTHVDRAIRVLRLQVPTDSSLILDIFVDAEKAEGSLSIIAATVKFASSQRGATVKDVLSSILADIQTQIDGWIEKRVL